MRRPQPPPRSRAENALRVGLGSSFGRDLYHGLLTLSWPAFIAGFALAYLGLNGLFALAYLPDPNAIVHVRPGNLLDAFFFSVQTMATIGYGHARPGDLYGNVLVTLESLTGLFGLAIAAGLVFARFSRPAARVIFSHQAVVCRYEGIPTLMFRVANQRRNQILEARIQVTLIRSETSAEGVRMRRLRDLRLVRATTPSFALSWTVMHQLTVDSPLHALHPDPSGTDDSELIVILTGLDDTLSQTVHARYTYRTSELRWNQQFADILSQTPDGRTVLDFSRFQALQPADTRHRL
ncbi:MAG TPA: ion channel [Acidiferrobacteraceae bacterium]|nr:ion channel [Acidiferrobacteraceae bacterium]